MTTSTWFASLWQRRAPDQVLQHHLIELDEPVESLNERGRGSYGAIFRVKYNGANCVAKRILDILVGLGAHQYVGEDQYKLLLDRFRAECDLLSKFRHPNVVQFLGICQPTPDPRTLTLVMEEMHINLNEFIETSKPIETNIKLEILRDVSAGVLHIHSHGVIHRDLNAGNVLLTHDLRAKITDFGMSRLSPSDQPVIRGDMTVMPGAPDYMPPEAMTGSYNMKLDTFSLGHLMLYLTLEQYPSPKYYSLLEIREMTDDQNIEVLKRKQWLDRMGKDHKLYDLTVQCLMDKPEERPTMGDFNKRVTAFCSNEALNYCLVLKNKLEQYKTAIMELIQTLPDDLTSTQSKAAEIDDLKQQLEHSNEELQRQTIALQEKESLLQEKDHSIDEQRHVQAQLIQEIHDKNEMIERQSLELEQLQREFEQIRRQTEEKQILIQQKDAYINEQKQVIDQLQLEMIKKIQEKSGIIDRQANDLERLHRDSSDKISQQAILLKEKDAFIDKQKHLSNQEQLKMTQEIVSKNEEIQEKNGIITTQVNEIEHLRKQLSEQEKQLQTAVLQLNDTHTAQQIQESSGADLKQALSQLENEKKELECKCRQLEEENLALVQQNSQLSESSGTIQKYYDQVLEDKRKLEVELLDVKNTLAKATKEEALQEQNVPVLPFAYTCISHDDEPLSSLQAKLNRQLQRIEDPQNVETPPTSSSEQKFEGQTKKVPPPVRQRSQSMHVRPRVRKCDSSPAVTDFAQMSTTQDKELADKLLKWRRKADDQ